MYLLYNTVGCITRNFSSLQSPYREISDINLWQAGNMNYFSIKAQPKGAVKKLPEKKKEAVKNSLFL